MTRLPILVIVLCIIAAGSIVVSAHAVPPYADDGGSGQRMTQVGDTCSTPGSVTTGYNPTTNRVVTLMCQCNEVFVCFWVQISGYRAKTTIAPVNEEDHTGGCVPVYSFPWYCVFQVCTSADRVIVGWRC